MTSQGQDSLPGVKHFLRSIHKDRTQQSPIFSFLRTAFVPSKADDDGFSVFVEECTSLAEVSRLAESVRRFVSKTPADCYVVRLPVACLAALNFTLKVDEHPDPKAPPGHHLIPELSLDSYKKNEKVLKDKQRTLARIATENIILRPNQQAEEKDSLRGS